MILSLSSNDIEEGEEMSIKLIKRVTNNHIHNEGIRLKENIECITSCNYEF